MYVNTTAEVKAETDYCVTSSNAVQVVEHIYREHGPDTEILFGPDMFLGAYVEKQIGPQDATSGTASATSTRASARRTSPTCAPPTRARTSSSTRVRVLDRGVMEYVAAGDVDAEGVHMLSTGGMMTWAAQAPRAPPRSWPRRPGCCTRSRWRAPTSTSSPPTRRRRAAT